MKSIRKVKKQVKKTHDVVPGFEVLTKKAQFYLPREERGLCTVIVRDLRRIGEIENNFLWSLSKKY